MAWRLRALAVLAQDLGSAPRDNSQPSGTPVLSVISVPEDMTPSPGLYGRLRACTQAHTLTHKAKS